MQLDMFEVLATRFYLEPNEKKWIKKFIQRSAYFGILYLIWSLISQYFPLWVARFNETICRVAAEKTKNVGGLKYGIWALLCLKYLRFVFFVFKNKNKCKSEYTQLNWFFDTLCLFFFQIPSNILATCGRNSHLKICRVAVEKNMTRMSFIFLICS